MKYDLEKVGKLLTFYNLLSDLHEIPIGELYIQLDDGYTGELYEIDWDYGKGSFILSIGDDFVFSVIYHDGTCDSGLVSEVSVDYLADMIKSVIAII